jgi:nitrite reductase/ring-hydroxylating ferredoxin subunit
MVALVAPGALVAACSDSEPTGSGDPAPTNSGGKSLAKLADVPDGGGVVVANPAGGMVLLVRSGAEVKGYNAACTHMGTTVGAPTAGVVTCPNHGSQFDTSTGDVKKGPATVPLPTVTVKVDGDQVVLA